METIQIAQATIGTTTGATEQTTSASEKFLSKEQYLTTKETWASTKYHSASDTIIYNVLRSLSPSRGFTPLTDRKISSRSNDRWDGFNKALGTAKYATSPRRFTRDSDSSYANGIALAESKFKAIFGIELTEGIKEAIKAIVRLE